MQEYEIRQATPDDMEQIMAMIDHSRQLMRRYGNHEQWTGGYPSETIISDDIANGNSWMIIHSGRPVATFALVEGIEPTYIKIEGKWEDDESPYGTLHRLACAAGEKGLFDICLDWCRRQVTSLRIDTHADNKPMLHLAKTRGFDHRGIVFMEDGSPREAFQMLNTGCLCNPLRKHIEENILPLYDNFDTAHQRDHVNTVINNSLQLAQALPVEINMVYAIAAYHDIGLAEGRETHHISSAKKMLADPYLSRWFSNKKLTQMAEAIEDHRASSGHEPRSLYGKIVAEADRDIEPMRIIRRTVQYGISHNPEYNNEQQWQRTLEHLQEKYAEGGYLKLFFPNSPNSANLEMLRQIIADKERLHKLFAEIYAEETG